jgi:hypothetical protein
MERQMKRKIKGMLAAVLCHRAMHGLAAAVYAASASGLAGKEVAGWLLGAVYAVLAARR